MSKRIIILGPAHPLRGGIAAFNERLAKAFTAEGHSCTIVSFKYQYPEFLFPGKTQYSKSPAPVGVDIKPLVHSLNPLNWVRTAQWIAAQKPDIILVRFWLPLMAPALGSILRLATRNKKTRVVCLADNVLPHEKRPGDGPFTRYLFQACAAFLVMSEKVRKDLLQFNTTKPVTLLPHPLYDHFGAPVGKKEARAHLSIPPSDKLVLFFGFIRKYKGLDLLLEAMADERVKAAGIRLLIAGEFYEEEAPYREQILRLQLQERVLLHNDFIPDEAVKYYLCAADCVVQPYRNATQSGVTPLAYHFEKPMVVTNVGGLPDLVPHEKVGLVTAPEPKAIADGLLRFYALGADHFAPFIKEEKQKYSWERMVQAIIDLAAVSVKS
ncbi:Glycosyltransferase involved in cell wall bisynthesis [Cnuella takakiae]|uniref:Glycosyltransferase involved in cell wall bisynthesis n=1 Tax=Cnuella takakiae TaxID=1302690 RepID=A0A1M5HEV4_9BACT|nr:glycosyltransferase [Cnuella takakiae]OLY92847.1 glycosyl transferase family 1 [Cnuella takakiae]SHG14486.1 Glycosyltransferase involved in cell wall bisynthesis [Cnuella takakiae]